MAFVDYQRGEPAGDVRFRTPAAAAAALAALQAGAADVGGAAPSWRALSEAEEGAFFERAREKQQRTDGKGKGKGEGSGISFGSRGRGRGRW